MILKNIINKKLYHCRGYVNGTAPLKSTKVVNIAKKCGVMQLNFKTQLSLVTYDAPKAEYQIKNTKTIQPNLRC